MISILAGGDAYSAVRVGNATRNNYYANQMAEHQYTNSVASTNDIEMISGNDMSSARNGASDGDSVAAACSAIYPNGEFEIARPTAGIGRGGAKTCTSVVELRGYQMGPNGSDVVLARANVASGSTVKCNISDFPEASYTLDAQNVIFPADAEPTVEDVKKVMDAEQKQNAGLKIAAAALVGAIGGNISGKNDAGKDNFMGTDKGKMKNTVIGALGGAAVGAGGAYGGYTGGNMIMSAGMNAAAGGVAGNIMAAGDSVLRIEKCGSDSCLWGYLLKTESMEPNKNYYVDLIDGKSVMKCNTSNDGCEWVNNLVSIKIKDNTEDKILNLEDLDANKIQILTEGNHIDVYYLEEGPGSARKMQQNSNDTSHQYALIDSARVDTGPKTPVVLKGFQDSAFGKKTKDWREEKKNFNGSQIYYRGSNGEIGNQVASADIESFFPMYVDSTDGGIVDLGNKARLKSTLIGAGAGGALGAFTAYEGAQSDIDERWVSAVREYKDSLQKFYCVTGSRFLSYYNDVVFIPNVNE